ncbi:MAG: hypothetical protein V1743_03910, partial [Nanoarchaeota archaeon]
IIIGIIGFFWSSFVLVYNNIRGGFLFALFFLILGLEAYILKIRVKEHLPEYILKTKEQKKRDELRHPFFKSAPLSSGYMLTSMLGILIAIFVIIPLELTWGFTFLLLFIIMFISSIISMSNAPVGDEALEELHLQELAIHNKIHRKK